MAAQSFVVQLMTTALAVGPGDNRTTCTHSSRNMQGVEKAVKHRPSLYPWPHGPTKASNWLIHVPWPGRCDMIHEEVERGRGSWDMHGESICACSNQVSIFLLTNIT